MLGLLCTGCPNAAGDCRNTLSCPLPADAGTIVIYVTSDGGTPCDGTCVSVAEYDWQVPALVWLGYDASLAPECPEQAPVKKDYRAAPAAPPCAACECGPPTGSCALPTRADANSTACPSDRSAQHALFDPPSGWDGACTAEHAVAANLDCTGDSCVRSVTFGPLDIKEDGCAPKAPVVPHDHEQRLTFARACVGEGHGDCADNGQACTPAKPPNMNRSAGSWAYCVAHVGADDAYTMACPMAYPIKHVFSIDYRDTRACAPCACDPPEGSTCSALISVYGDGVCSSAQELGSIMVSSSGPMCLNLPPGAPLGSKAAAPPHYEPGGCRPTGGEPTGSVENIGPYTFCCRADQ